MSYTLFKSSWKDLIFEKRNKEYGAYVLRSEYDNYVIGALLIAVVLAGLSIGGPALYEKFIGDKFQKEEMKEVILTDVLPPPPPENPNEPPPPPPPPVEMPKVETIKFLPPEVKKDEEVVEPPPTIEEVKEAVISNKTEEGVKGDETTVVVEEAAAPIIEEKEEEAILYAEQMPEFPGGPAEMFKFFSKNINYPREAANMDIQGRVALALEIDKDGSVTKITVTKSLGYGTDEEAIRVAKMMPKWNPGKMNGRAVKVKVVVPIKFQLNK